MNVVYVLGTGISNFFVTGVCPMPLPLHVILDYQVSICSLIPPATAISKTQDRADTSV